MRTNTDMTLYNRRIVDRKESFARTVVRGVSWFSKYKTTLTEKGLVGANEFSVRIPASAITDGKQYVPPHLSDAADTAKTWTLRPGDWIVKGVHEGELEDVSRGNPEAVEIKAASDRRDERLSPHTHHWRVMA